MDAWNERHLMALFALFGLPGSYLDIGCGSGAMVKLARRLNIEAFGLDLIEHPEEWLRAVDLRQPYSMGRTFALVSSFEVAEHIPPKDATTFIQTVTDHVREGGLLIFSAAHPGQGGEGHVNLQPASWWRGRIDPRGMTYQPELTSRLSHAWTILSTPMYWLAANVQVFSRGAPT
jgi:cyclopropane fatty-acyl-phospholipid synthase-like methyltransferase